MDTYTLTIKDNQTGKFLAASFTKAELKRDILNDNFLTPVLRAIKDQSRVKITAKRNK